MSGEARFEIYPQMRDMAPIADPKAEQIAPGQEPTGEYGWRFQSANGQVTATGGEGYTRREDASRAIHDFLDAVAGAQPHPLIIDVEK